MKNLLLIFGCLFALSGFARLAAESPTPGVLKKDVQKTAGDAKIIVKEKKEAYEMRIRAELEDLKEKIAALHRREKDLEADLRRVRASGDVELKKLKVDIDRNMVKLKEGYNDLLDKMKVK